MNENETSIVEDLEAQVKLDELETISIKEVKANKPKIFGADTFEFTIGNINKAKVKRNVKTAVGYGNMYILDTMPPIFTFANAYEQLTDFCKDEKLKSGDKIRYIRNYIPDGKLSYDTTYEFEKGS